MDGLPQFALDMFKYEMANLLRDQQQAELGDEGRGLGSEDLPAIQQVIIVGRGPQGCVALVAVQRVLAAVAARRKVCADRQKMCLHRQKMCMHRQKGPTGGAPMRARYVSPVCSMPRLATSNLAASSTLRKVRPSNLP